MAAGLQSSLENPNGQQISMRWGTKSGACPFLNLFSLPEGSLTLTEEPEANQDPKSTPHLPPAYVSTRRAPASSGATPHSHLLDVGWRIPLDQIL